MALSGGIDSAVSAYLLIEQGYRVEAAFMKNWSSTKGLLKDECPWLQDRQDALRVAAFLKITLNTLDFEKQYEKNVLEYFFKEYQAGHTPNPDVMCNKEIKFKLLYNWAMKNGFDYLATGHYAQIDYRGKSMGDNKAFSNIKPIPYILKRSVDEFKDQTYFIYNILESQLSRVLFPIGGMKKTAVRKLAQKIKLPNADKKESMGLCFVGKIRLKDFLGQRLRSKKGTIVDQQGRKIGEHEGLYNYTIGQRQGVRVGGSGPYYVTSKDLITNTLHVTNNPNDQKLETKEMQIHSVNWIDATYKKVTKKIKLKGRFRHQGDLVLLTVEPQDKGFYKVIFGKPQKALASGQSLVLYKGKQCVGGGIIA